MAKGYWIANADWTEMAVMQRYRSMNQAVLAKYEARVVVAGGQSRVAEGEPRSRHVVLEFPSYAAAVACYDDPDYQAALQVRRQGSTGSLVIIEGFQPPTA